MSIYPELEMASTTSDTTTTTTTTTTPIFSSDKDMELCVSDMERTLNYTFKNKKLLEEALTHSSYTKSTSYQRLEFIGDCVLKLAFANYAFFAYPTVDESVLHILCKYNTTNDKLARVAVYNGFYRCVRRCDLQLDAMVQKFARIVEAEDKSAVYRGRVKAPKILADIVESISAAVYFDCDFDLKFLWEVMKGLLEPFITLETLPLQLVTLLTELCEKQGKQIDIRHLTKSDKNKCRIYVDAKLVATGTSDQKDIAEIKAADSALDKLNNADNMDVDYEVIDKDEIKNAKMKLHELCDKNKWLKPTYSRFEQEIELGNEKKFKCNVKIKIEDVELIKVGDAKSKVKEAENSAASVMIHSLVESGFV